MIDTNIGLLLLVGFLGGGHCAGMCGGIVTALSLNLPKQTPFYWMLCAYNIGRLLSYTLMGVLLGSVTALGLTLTNTNILQTGLAFMANLMLFAMGLYLSGIPTVITRLEQLGRPIWRYIQPVLGRLLPIRHLPGAVIVGMFWGWLPCGLVYSAALSALATGSAWQGGLLMLAFGLGTLPNLLLMGTLADTLRPWLQKRLVRYLAGGSIGLIGCVRLIQLVYSTIQQ